MLVIWLKRSSVISLKAAAAYTFPGLGAKFASPMPHLLWGGGPALSPLFRALISVQVLLLCFTALRAAQQHVRAFADKKHLLNVSCMAQWKLYLSNYMLSAGCQGDCTDLRRQQGM